MKQWVFLAGALLFWAGCLDFEKQTLTYRHYPKADTLVIWQQFEGIYGRNDAERLTGEEIRQLESVLAGRRTFFFSNWITEYNMDAMAESEASLKQKIAKGEFDEDPELVRRQLELVQLVRKNVTIQNGKFYLNAQGRLAATQSVTIRNVSKILALSNELIRVALRDSIARDETGLSARDEHLLERSLENQLEYLTLKDQHLRVRWPMSAKSFKAHQDDDELKNALGHLQKSGGAMTHAQGVMTVELKGKPGQPTALSGTTGEHKYRGNAVRFVNVAPDYQPKAARADFFRQTDALYKK